MSNTSSVNTTSNKPVSTVSSFGATFVDTMDTNRLLQPVREENGKLVYKVYWKATKGAPTYGGNTSLPKHMFSDSNFYARVGFRSQQQEARLQAEQKQLEERQKRWESQREQDR